MDIDIVKEILSEFELYKLTKLKVKTKDIEINIEKENRISAPLDISYDNTKPSIKKENKENNLDTKDSNQIVSPMVGTVYLAPSPDSEPFVKVGQRVKKGDVVCIIEAMKLMNEVEAEHDGEIKEILVQNEQMVQYSEPLFTISP